MVNILLQSARHGIINKNKNNQIWEKVRKHAYFITFDEICFVILTFMFLIYLFLRIVTFSIKSLLLSDSFWSLLREGTDLVLSERSSSGS